MSLEQRVNELMDRAVEASAPMLEATTGQLDPNVPLPVAAHMEIIHGRIAGVRDAIILLAREIDELRDV
jgi:hypothetical protein